MVQSFPRSVRPQRPESGVRTIVQHKQVARAVKDSPVGAHIRRRCGRTIFHRRDQRRIIVRVLLCGACLVVKINARSPRGHDETIFVVGRLRHRSGILKRSAHETFLLGGRFEKRPSARLVDHRHLRRVNAVVGIEASAGNEETVAALPHEIPSVIPRPVAADVRCCRCEIEGRTVERHADETLAVAADPEAAFPVAFQPVDAALQSRRRGRRRVVVELQQRAVVVAERLPVDACAQAVEREQIDACEVVRSRFLHQVRRNAPCTHKSRLTAGHIEVERARSGGKLLHRMRKEVVPERRIGEILLHADRFQTLIGGHRQPVAHACHVIAGRHGEMPFDLRAGEIDPHKTLVGGDESIVSLHSQLVYGQIFVHGLFDGAEVHQLPVARTVEIDVAVAIKQHQPAPSLGVADV